MSDFPYVGPPADGLHLAMATARGRRLRKAGASGSASALALAAVALLAGGAGNQTLIQQPAPQVPAVHRVDKVPSGTVDRPARTTGTTALGAGSSLPGTSVSVPGAPVAPAAPTLTGDTTSPARGSTSIHSPVRATGEMKSGYGNYNSIDSCPVNKGASQQRLICPSVSTSDTWNSDNTKVVSTTLVGDVCSFDASAIDLHFSTTGELDFVVRDSVGRQVWRWSLEHPAQADRHAIRLTAGDCWQWATPWTFVDQAGKALPTGTYTVEAISSAAELGRQNTSTVGYPVS